MPQVMSFTVYGESIVNVTIGKGTGDAPATSQQLGLAEGPITVTPRYYHKDIHTDDFGDSVGPEVQVMLADAVIEMTLVFYSSDILNSCLASSIGSTTDGTLAGAGTLLGASGNLINLAIMTSAPQEDNWIFPSSYLMETPMVLPIGTKRSLTRLRWRAIPYWTPEAGVPGGSPNPLFGPGGAPAGVGAPGAAGNSGDPVSAGTIVWHH